MISSIKIYNRFNMDMFRRTGGLNFPYKRWYLISIHNDPSDILMDRDTVSIFKALGLVDYLDMEFWDVNEQQYRKIKNKYPDITIFTKDHANAIIKFLSQIKLDILDAVLIIHCHAGISRSGAVGTFACDYLKLDYLDFVKENTDLVANQYIFDILKQESKIYITSDYYKHKEVFK